MKNRVKFFALACILMLTISVATVFVSYGADAEYTADTDYSPVSMQTDSFNAAKTMVTSGSKTTYLTYLHDLGGNTALAIAPGINGTAPNHVYLSYRNDTAGSSKILYVGKSGVTSPEAPCDTDFLTLDIDIGAVNGIPDGMSISLNGREYTSASASSPSGNAFLYLRDSDGMLAISGTGHNDTYVDTGLDITKKLAHITLVLDTREVAQSGADSIRAYAYVNGKFITEINHGFTDSTDIINEIRIDFNQGKAVCKTTDTVLVDNVNMRSFKTGEYTGNLGGVLEDSTKTLLDFDKSVYDENYTLSEVVPVKIAKIGIKDYYSLGELAKDAKSGDVIRFLPLSADRPTNLGATIKYADTSSKVQSDGVLFAIFDADGNLISEHTSYYDSQTSTDHFYNAIEQLNGKGGYIELYADVESRTRVFTATDKANTVTNLVFSLNGYTFTPKVYKWSDLSTNNGHKEFIFNGPGNITTTNSTIFSFGIGAGKSTAAFNNVKITCGESFITGQSGVFTFNNCDISWTNDCSSGSSGFVTAFGGPKRNSVIPTLTFKDCRINHTATKSPTGTRAPFIGTNSISTSAAENPITTVVNIENCVIDTVGNLWFANANKSNSKNMLMPTPTFNIVDSKIKAYMIASAYNGNNITINVSGNTELNISKKLTEPSGSISVTYTSGNLNGQTVTYTSKTALNIGEGVSCNIKPASAANATVNLGGKLLALASNSGYIVENPTLKANVSMGADFNFNFYVPKSDFVSAKIDGIALPTDEEITVNGETYVKIVYEGIAPATAGISKSTVFTFRSGEREYIAKYSASIPKYINLVYSGSGYAEERSEVLLAAIARYIKAAYTYFGKTDGVENIDALISLTAGVSVPEVDESALTAVNTMTSVSEAFTDATLALESTPRVRFILNPAFSGAVTVAGKNYTVEAGIALGKTYVDVSLSAKNIMSTITVKVGNKSAQFNAVSYFNYLKSISDTNTDAAKAIPVVEALFNYSAAASKYIDHVFSSEWSYDKTHHWHVCTDSGCIISADRAEHDFDEEGICVCGQIVNLEDGEGEFLQALGINKNIKTDLDDMKFAKVLNNSNASYTFTAENKSAVNTGDIILFSFVVKAKDASAPLSIKADLGTIINKNPNEDSKTMTYYVPVQWTRIYMPIKNNGMANVTLETTGTVYIAEAKFENCGNIDIETLNLKSGMWMIDDFEKVELKGSGTYLNPENKTGAVSAVKLSSDGKYLFSIGYANTGTFSITDTETGEVVGQLTGLGGELRQLAITEDDNYAMMTARASGACIIDMTDKTAPKLASSYNTVELATGLYISGNYAFVTNRYHGVEVVDITTPTKPVQKANIYTGGEVQSCVVYNNILYCGVWGECGIWMYDLSELETTSELTRIGKVTCNGKGDGLTVTEIGGRTYIFAATGQHTYLASTTDPFQNLAYGQGNGLDIFDVTNPASPIHISTSKIDGRYYYTGNDFWEAEVSYDEASGKYYAYLVNTYNGVYVYDVTNLSAPIRLTHITLPLTATAGNKLTHSSRTIITSWDQTYEARSAVGSIAVKNGVIYLAGTASSVHKYENASLFYNEYESGSNDVKDLVIGDVYSNLETGLSSNVYTFWSENNGQVLSISTYGNYIYVASGSDGILVFDKNTFSASAVPVYTYAPKTVNGRVGFASSIEIKNGRLYCAEDVAGLGVYTINADGSLTEIEGLRYQNTAYIISQVRVSPNCSYAVVQINSNRVGVIPLNYDTNTHGDIIVKNLSGGHLYHRNLSDLINGRYILAWNHVGFMYWIDFNPQNGVDSAPIFTSTTDTAMSTMICGIASYEDKAIFMRNNNYRIYSEIGAYTGGYTDSDSTPAGTSFTGKPTVCGNYLVVTRHDSGMIYILDISNIEKPNVIHVIDTVGNPDIAYYDESGTVYIPLGNQGLLTINLNAAFGASAQA